MFSSDSQQVNSARLDLLVAVAESPRFRGMRVGEYAQRDDQAREQQFAAVTFDMGDCTGIRSTYGSGGLLYVAFRGTDGTLLGWKEDFNMAFRCPVPSQDAAADYVTSILDRSAGVPGGEAPGIMIGGHSKGGNMAVYAAVHAADRDLRLMQRRADESGDTQLPAVTATANDSSRDEHTASRYAVRIRRVFSHDGPGFPRRLQTAAFDAMASRVSKTVPESSVVGMLMDDHLPYHVVKADAVGIMQHLGVSWQSQDGEFVTAPGLSATARFVGSTVNAWMLGIDPADRKRVLDQLYVIFSAPGYRSFGELADNWTTAVPSIVAATRQTDRDTRRLVAGVLAALPATAWHNLPQVPQLVIDSLR